MRRTAAFGGALACLACLAGCGRETAEQPAADTARSAPASTFTSLSSGACQAPADDVRAAFAAKDLGVQECPGAGPWQVLLVSSDERSWLELRSPRGSWSAEDAIVYESPIGLFPNVDDSERLEWRTADAADPVAVIFNVAAQDPEQPDTRVSRYFVVRLDGTPCVVDRAPTREEAVAIADTARGCAVAR